MVGPLLTTPNEPAALPVIIALTVVGIAAVAGATWWGIDKNEKAAAVEHYAAQAAAEVDAYIRDLQVRATAGQPLPPPPKSIVTAAKSEANNTIAIIGAGVVLGGAAVWGLMRSGTSSAPRRANPARRAPLRRRRSRARAAPSVRRASPAKRAKTKRNPKRTAKKLTARRNPKRTAKKLTAKRNPKRTAKKLTKRNPKRTAKKLTKRNPRPKSGKFGRPKGDTARSRFIRGQMNKGRTKKQAESTWRMRQAAKKKKGKARARR